MALLTLFATEHAQAAQSQWWNTNYAYRQQIDIDAGSAQLVAGYSISFTFNHAAEVTAGRSLASGDDARVVYWNGTTWKELDRVIDLQSSWNATTTQIWFATANTVSANADDNKYYLYYGNPAAGTPPQDPEKVFLLFDGFDSASVDTSRWTVAGTPSVASGRMTLLPGESVRSKKTFGTDTIWEARIQVSDNLPGGGSKFYYLWLANNGNNVSGAHAGIYADVSNFLASSRGTLFTSSDAIAAGNPLNWQTYSFARDDAGNRVLYWRDGTLVSTINGFFDWNVPTDSLPALAYNNANGSREQRYDWVRIRYYSAGNPSASAYGDREQYVPVGQWRMEQTTWNGTANEVADTSGSNLALTSSNGAVTAVTTPAKSGNPGTCRYGVFDGTNDYLQRADNTALDLKSRVTVTAWIYPRSTPADLRSILSKDDNYEFHLNSSRQIYWWWGGAPKDLTTTGTAVPLNQWTHVAITYESGEQHIYINGVLRASDTQTGNLPLNNLPLQIGQDQGLAGRYWDGYIDEVEIYNRPLSQTEVQAAMNATHPCVAAAPPHFVINHSGYAIACAGSIVKVYARDAANNPNTAYNSTIKLDTQTGQGTWSLNQGSGAFTSLGNGQATYQWPLGATEAWFTLQYPNGGVISDIDAYQVSDVSIRDDDTEGALTFTPSGFTLTSSALANPPPTTIPAFITPQTAGTSVPLYIAAYGQTANDPTCGIIEGYAGNKSLSFSTIYFNPATGSRTATVNGTAADNLTLQTVAFTNGQAQVSLKYKDVGVIAVGAKDSTSNPQLPSGISGATTQIVFKPAGFTVTAVKRPDNTDNPAASSANGTVFVKAGRPFSATITAVDAEGSATPNFGQESPKQSVELSTILVLPLAGKNPPVIASSGMTFTNGVAAQTNLSWGEAGIMQIRPHVDDSDYLGGGDVVGPTSANIGRFIPDHFDVATIAPTFNPGCTAGGFTYIGQPLTFAVAPIINVQARSSANGATENYTGAFMKITNATLTKTYKDASNNAPITLGVPATNPATPPGDPTITDLGSGIISLTFSSGSGLRMTRKDPVIPFTAQIQLLATISDSDGVKYANALTGDTVIQDIGFTGNLAEQRYGRLSFHNAVGSELLPLALPLRAEYFDSAANGFKLNDKDTCTSVTLQKVSTVGTLTLSSVCVQDTGNPGSSGIGCASPASAAQRFRSPPVSPTPPLPPNGDFNLYLAAPGANKQGTVLIRADAPAWLQFDWDGSSIPAIDPASGETTGMENPSGTATFGIYQGQSSRIYQGERY